ncbi:MAG: type IV secretory system conjugative DNA transfer family protein [candidate division SR1 bacterium]|nr:type IV secretory system conjugative DNA transfer family protein [candidate division SR1 bacterium]
MNNILIIIIIAGGIRLIGSLIVKAVFSSIQKKHRKEQANKLRYIQIKIPKSVTTKGGEDGGDTIKDMKQNMQIMNQIYKNFYSIIDDKRSHRKFGHNYISMEMFIEKEVIKFIMAIPEEDVDNMEKLISSFYIGAVVDPIDQPKLLEAGKYMAGGEFVLTKDNAYPLKNYESFEADPMDSLLSAYSKVLTDEKMCLQILISPLDENALKQLRKESKKIKDGKNKGFLGLLLKDIWKGIVSANSDSKDAPKDEEKKSDLTQQQTGDLDKKAEEEIFSVKIRALVTSPDPKRPERIIEDLARGFSQYSYIGLNALKFKKAKKIQEFAKEFINRMFRSDNGMLRNLYRWKKKMIISIKELSSIIHIPNAKFNRNPRISRQKYKIVPAPDNIPTDGILLGFNTYAGIKKEIRIMTNNDDRMRHMYIVGQTGSGKSTLIKTAIMEDLRLGNGFCVIDPHGDLVDDTMKYFPKEKIDDLIYFDLANTEYPIAFNPLDGAETDDERDVVTNDLVEMFVSMYGEEIFGPRIQDYFRNACFLLMEQPEGGTLIDIMRLFTDDAFAESKIRNVKNPIIAARWNKTYKKMGEREKSEIIPFIQAKFGPFTTGTYIRNVIGQPKSAFNFFDAMNQGKIILVKLSKGLTGEENSKLLGRMVTMQIKLSALKRASLDEKERHPYFLYIDEFQNYVSKSIESILSEARKYKLGLTIAHQYIDQLKQEGLGGALDLSKTIFGNVGNLFIFKVGAPDAEFLEKEFGPEFSAIDMVNGDTHRAVVKIVVNNQPTRPFSFTTDLPFSKPILNIPEKIEIMKQISALKWGTKRELVDKEIYFRVGV